MGCGTAHSVQRVQDGCYVREQRCKRSCLRTIRGTSSSLWIRTDIQPSDYGFSSEDDKDDKDQ